jgi:hypothetical protein
LRYGEYRESVDIDFLVSDATGYRELRQLITGTEGLNAVVRPGAQPLEMLREVRADQYGLRTVLQMDGQAIKCKAIDRLQERHGWLERCMQAMAMTLPRAVLWQKIRALRKLLKTGVPVSLPS